MQRSTAKVRVQRTGQVNNESPIVMPNPSYPKANGPKDSLKNVSASSVCANDKAHNLRYDAVFDTVPRTNSIVSII